MTEAALSSILHYRRESNWLSTSGQPSAEELVMVASANFQVVINLVPSASQGVMPDERAIVESLGMRYLSIPVNQERPTRTNLVTFFDTMESLTETPTLIHCIDGSSVGCFLALFRVLRRGWSVAEAIALTHDLREPHPIWRKFFDRRLVDRALYNEVAYNRGAWNRQAAQGNLWTLPVDSGAIAEARAGRWSVLLTASKPVPREWFGELAERDILCLASGGGQQGPILAATGARVTVLDSSPAQLDRDREVAEREELALRTIAGDMADLSVFSDCSFDLVFHPVSNVFAADVRPVWREVARVLRPGGILLAGFMNPSLYIFDTAAIEQRGVLRVKYPLPYSDLHSLSDKRFREVLETGYPLEFSHTLGDLIGGQTAAGLLITALYEDRYPPADDDMTSRFMPSFMATRALKPG